MFFQVLEQSALRGVRFPGLEFDNNNILDTLLYQLYIQRTGSCGLIPDVGSYREKWDDEPRRRPVNTVHPANPIFV